MLSAPENETAGTDDGFVPHRHSEAAEQVRAWLVTARGGSPFLSGSDAKALAEWFDEGVSVSQLLRAIDETSRHRRANRLRVPFTLRSIRPRLRKPGGVLPTVEDAAGLPWPTLEQVPSTPAEAITAFEGIWATLQPEHVRLYSEALDEFRDFADSLDEHDVRRLCEEYARERVRSHYPALSALNFV